MERYNLHLKDSQLKTLKEIAEAKEETVSRIIRDAIDGYIKANK